MTSRRRVLCLALLPLLLTGCTTAAAATSAPTVTVTVMPPAPTVQPGDSAPWDLGAVCAAESEAEALIVWRDQQTRAHRLSTTQSEAVLQAIAVQYLELDQRGVSDQVQQDVALLRGSAGTLEHPRIDLSSKAVASAKDRLHHACQDSGHTIGVVAQGG